MEFLAEKGSIETMKKYTDKHRDNIPGKDYPQNSDHTKLSCFEKWLTKNLGYLHKILYDIFVRSSHVQITFTVHCVEH